MSKYYQINGLKVRVSDHDRIPLLEVQMTSTFI